MYKNAGDNGYTQLYKLVYKVIQTIKMASVVQQMVTVHF
jgi:hypothetical protein